MTVSRSRSLAALLVVCLGTLAAPLDSAVNIAFPSITAAFGLPQAGIRWVIISYVLTYASLTLVFGKLGDLLGYRRVFVAGLVMSAAGYAACSLAPHFALLLAGRVLQGVGAALTWSCAPALATSLYPESERTRVLGFYSAAIAIGAALGPLAGGALVANFGWQVVFWARLPFVATAFALAWLIPAGAPSGDKRRLDWTGALLLVAWLSAFLLAAARPEMPHGAAVAGALVVLGAISLWAFLRHEARHADPIIRPALFRDRAFLVVNLASIAVNLAGFAVMLLVPFHLARTAGLDPGLGGLVLGANATGVVVGSWAAGRLSTRLGHTAMAIAGALVSVAGLALVSSWSRGTPPGVMAACLGAQGFGLGLFQVAYTDRVLATLPQADRGVAGSLTLVTRTIGIVGAAAGLSELSRQLELAAVAAGTAQPALVAFQTSFRLVSIGLGAGLMAVVIGLLMSRPPGRRR
ncbi:MAG: MFS transporter [Hyphomicrobiaceae bacterium]|nr:MFS transporter [Hyphomicrobiaceae bacterium]